MTFYKIKHIAVKRDGAILFAIGKLGEVFGEVFKHKNGHFYLAHNGDEVTPLYDSITGDLVGFCDVVVSLED